jgi:O-antigen/teichoic acid export membrane protein
MSDTRTVAHNTLSQVAARVTSLIASFLIIPVLTRYLGPDLFGVYSLVLVFNSLLISLADLGIQTIATREASRDNERAEFYSAQAVILRVISTLLITAISILAISFTPYQNVVKVSFAIVASAVIFNSIQAGLTVFLQARLQVYLASLADMIGRVASTAFTLLMIILATHLALSKDAGLYLVLVGVGVGTAIAAFSTLVFSLRTRIFHARLDRELAKTILRDSIPLWAVTVVSFINYRVDTVLLSLIKGSYDVGIYNLAYKILDITLTFPAFFMASVFPLLSRKLEDRQEFVNFSRRALEAMFLGAIPIGFGIFAISPQIVQILGGIQFSQAVLPLRILAIASIFSFIYQFLLYMIIIKNGQKLLFVITAFITTFNLALNLILIPRYSYNAAATVTLISEFLQTAILLVVVMNMHQFGWRFSFILRIILAGLVMLAAVTLTPTNNVLIIIPLASAVYLSAIVLLRAFDLQTVQEIVSRS